MRREAFHGERAADANSLVVLIGLVEEGFGLGVFGDGGVDLRAGHAFLDVGVVGDGFESDVGNALVYEAFADVVIGFVCGRDFAGEFGFFADAVGRIGQEVVGVFCAHQARAGQGESDAAGVAGDPAAAPLLGDIGGGAAAASGVEDEVAGVGGHQDAAFDDPCVGLHNVGFVGRSAKVSPHVVPCGTRKIAEVTDVAKHIPDGLNPSSIDQFFKAYFARFPEVGSRNVGLAAKQNRKSARWPLTSQIA